MAGPNPAVLEWAESVSVEGRGELGESAAHHAAMGGEPGALAVLLRRSARLAVCGDGDGDLPAHLAARGGHVACLEQLKDVAGDAALGTPNRAGRTPVFYAAGHGHAAAVAWLLANGMDGSLADEDGDTAAHLAVHGATKAGAEEASGPAVLAALVDKGADVTRQNKSGQSALHWAAHANAEGCVGVLAGAGAPLEARDSDGYTPLIEAARWGGDRAAAALLRLGADAAATDAEGWTALLRAAWWCHAGVVAALLAGGADAGAKTPDGRGARDLAMESEGTSAEEDRAVCRALDAAGAP